MIVSESSEQATGMMYRPAGGEPAPTRADVWREVRWAVALTVMLVLPLTGLLWVLGVR